MRAVWGGFALGVVLLQQQTKLPGWLGGVGLFLLINALAGCAVWGLRGHGWRRRSGWCAVWCAAAGVGFGYAAWRAHERLALSLPLDFEGRPVEVSGAIRGLPIHDAMGARFLFEVEATQPPLAGFPHTIQLSWIARDAPLPQLDPGARWRLPVRLKRPHGNANFGVRDAEAGWLARDIRARGYVSAPAAAVRLPGTAQGLSAWVNRWRAALRHRINTVLDDAPHRGIVTALAIGAQDGIREADWQLLRTTGTSHLVAISGMHIGLAAAWAGWLAGSLWRRWVFGGKSAPLLWPTSSVMVLAGVLFAAAHAALAGFNVPAQRALWMLGVAALALLSGRQMALSVVLAWALGLVLLIDPWAVVTAGFWLSFGAVAAILLALSGRPRELVPRAEYAPETEMHADSSATGEASANRVHTAWAFWRDAWQRLQTNLRSGFQVQLAVTVALAPLTIVWFSQVPLLGLAANAFAIPWVSVLVTPLVLLGVILPAPLDALAWRAAHGLLEWLMQALQLVAQPAWTLWRLPQPDGWALAAAGVGVLWCLAPRGWPLRWAAPLTWLPLLFPVNPVPPAGAFRLTALDIGQGSAILVETARHTLLFDAGPGPESTHAGERIVVPFLQARGTYALDALVISHADSDHAGGAPAVLDNIRVRQLLAALVPRNPLWARARQRGAQTVPCAAGQRWQWDGVEFAMLWPDPGPLSGRPNAHSCVLRISTASTAQTPGNAALLTGDLEAPGERGLLAREPHALQAQVLLVPHHGSKTSSTEPFLDAIGPSIAVFQVGYRNRFRHPHPFVWARYQARQIELTRSDEDGAVRIDVTREGLALERYRTTHQRYWMGR
ncbi:DNA internalization-related competence protein ComEC/Rec2 [Paraburkholderia bonniea]|uniref:DNA internalization-related competence protein ComEC/Rec2 n=1 Tax=Paraburkholderia bonniea TaxID=2152891 RepID=UPI001290E6E4|nr:DNA internalization-related competence protein ComEC/Rec2 [Paraburkholderia bonniea]